MSYSAHIIEFSTSIAIGLKDTCNSCLELYGKFQKTVLQNDDYLFVREFKTDFIPSLYEVHTLGDAINCVFCSRLTRSNCHKHCLKCSIGTYLHCSPLLPGILCYESSPAQEEEQHTPWLYKEPCRYFDRLSRQKYFKNLLSPISWVKLYNFEVLEGLSRGVVDGKKPCHVCAAVDYEIYRDCLQCGKAGTDSPCYTISDAVGKRFIEAACR